MMRIPIGYRCSTERYNKSKQVDKRLYDIDKRIIKTLDDIKKSEPGSIEHKNLNNTLNQLEASHKKETKKKAQLVLDKPQFFNITIDISKKEKNNKKGKKKKNTSQILLEQKQTRKLREWNFIQADARKKRESASDSKKHSDLQKQKQKIIDNRKLMKELRLEKQDIREYSGMDINRKTMRREGIDIFISHASEDKDSIVRELANSLINEGVNVWYDEYSLSIGDSLSSSINKGLRECTFGIVVLSPYFTKKKWPEIELQSLYAKEIHIGKSILPIWHRITLDEVIEFNLHMADKFALNTSTHSIETITSLIIKELDKKLWNESSIRTCDLQI